jgi:hypothetical protein
MNSNSLELNSVSINELNILYNGTYNYFNLGLKNNPEVNRLNIDYKNASNNVSLSNELNSLMYNGNCTIINNSIYGHIHSVASSISNMVGNVINNIVYIPLRLDVRISNSTINIDNSIFNQKLNNFENWTYFNTACASFSGSIVIPNNLSLTTNFVNTLVNCESATILGTNQNYQYSNGSLQIYANRVDHTYGGFYNININKLDNSNNSCQIVMNGSIYDNITLNSNCTASLKNSSAICTNITLNNNASFINYSGTVLSLHLIGNDARFNKYSDNAIISKVFRDGELIEENV